MHRFLCCHLFVASLVFAVGCGGPSKSTHGAESPDAQPDEQTPDSLTPDVQTPDTLAADTQASDTQKPDAQAMDAPETDVLTSDAAGSDTQTSDTQALDTQTSDTPTPDADSPDVQSSCASTICDANATCSVDSGVPTCHCLGGFSGDGKSCADVDECALGTDTCNEHAKCENFPGTYGCQCQPGWQGDGYSCVDADECALFTSDCGAFSVCTNTPGTFTCACQNGFIGDGKTCTDVDECTAVTPTCSANATCENTWGSAICTCKDGYVGDGKTCADLDECAAGTGYCIAEASCVNTPGAFTCVCKDGYIADGKLCLDVDECKAGTATCDGNASCANTTGSYTCTCKDGFMGDGKTCGDIDECKGGTAVCDLNAGCTNTVGSYDCVCKDGYSGDGKSCSDVDECTVGTANCVTNAFCTNTPGAYTCACKPGYFDVAGTACIDIDECKAGTATCSSSAICANTSGSYTCTVTAGTCDSTVATLPAAPSDCALQVSAYMPTARMGMTAVTVASDIVLAGGAEQSPSGQGSAYVSTVYSTAIAAVLGGWLKSSPGTQPAHAAIVAMADRLYFFGGEAPASVQGVALVFMAKRGLDGAYASLVPMLSLPSPRTHMGIAATTTHAYLVGGGPSGVNYNSTNVTIVSFDADGNVTSYAPGTPLPDALEYPGTVVALGRLWLVGGNYNGNAAPCATETTLSAPINDDGSLGSWVPATRLPKTPAGYAVATDGGHLYVIGGVTVYGELFGGYFVGSVLSAPMGSDGTLGNWSRVAYFKDVRYGHAAVIVDGKLQIFGGLWNQALLNDVLTATVQPDGTLGGLTCPPPP